MPFKLRVNLETGEVEITPHSLFEGVAQLCPPREAPVVPLGGVAHSQPAQERFPYEAVVVGDAGNPYFQEMAGRFVYIQGKDGDGTLYGIFCDTGLPFDGWAPERVRKP